MAYPKYAVGTFVVNPKVPAWGPGKVMADNSVTVTVRFRNIRENRPGEAIKTLAKEHVTLEPAGITSDPFLDRLGTSTKSGKSAKPRKVVLAVPQVSIDEAFGFFLRHFPRGFEDTKYHRQERDNKWLAHEEFADHLEAGLVENMMLKRQHADVAYFCKEILARVHMASKFEIAALCDALEDGRPVRPFTEALFRLLDAGPRDQEAVESYILALGKLYTREGGSAVTKWPILTGLPFLGRPDRFMFLKPEATKDVAERLGFNLNYRPQLNYLTWSRLHDFGESLLGSLAPRGARDLIDVQSFVWVLHSYGEPLL